MCSYLSFFKQNTFHLHLSDSPGLNPALTYEEKLDFYSAFRLNSPDPAVEGLNKRANESYSQSDFEDIQQSCASRGVTIIPEIEAPGHALVINQWKPELALDTDFTLLNISHPGTIPTMETIWGTLLPWFHSKTVHLGADEYSSSEIADYNLYVNTMHTYIDQNFDKKVRIWGTFPPSKIVNETNIDHNVSIQHWEYFEANPYFDFMKNGYHVLNTDDQFYIVAKWSGSYPQKLNISLIFHGAPDGGPTAPYIFDKSNASNNPPHDSPYVLGQMPALWNDFGPKVPQLLRLIMLYVKVFQHSVTNNGEVTFSCTNISPSLRLYMPRFQDSISTGELIRKPTQSCLTISRAQGQFTISLEMGTMAQSREIAVWQTRFSR
jgi:hexosaminidase